MLKHIEDRGGSAFISWIKKIIIIEKAYALVGSYYYALALLVKMTAN